MSLCLTLFELIVISNCFILLLERNTVESFVVEVMETSEEAARSRVPLLVLPLFLPAAVAVELRPPRLGFVAGVSFLNILQKSSFDNALKLDVPALLPFNVRVDEENVDVDVDDEMVLSIVDALHFSSLSRAVLLMLLLFDI